MRVPVTCPFCPKSRPFNLRRRKIHASHSARLEVVVHPSFASLDKDMRRILARHPSVDGLEQRELLSTIDVSGQANIYGAGLTSSS